MKSRFASGSQDRFDSSFGSAEADQNLLPLAINDGGISVANNPPEILPTPTVLSNEVSSAGGQDGQDGDIAVLVPDGNFSSQMANGDTDDTSPEGRGMATGTVLLAPTAPVHVFAVPNPSLTNPIAGVIGAHIPEASISYDGAISAPADYSVLHASLNVAATVHGGDAVVAASVDLATPTSALVATADQANQTQGSSGLITQAGIGSGGARPAQVQQALDESGLSVNGSGIKVGVLSDSFNDLGGAATDEADGALPSASNIDVIKDLGSGGTDEGRAMMQIIHDIAPGASEAFYTAFDSEQDFANGILALAAAGSKVIVDDVSYFDEPFFQNGVVARAIQTVEAEGVTYFTAAGNNASNGYQAAWTPISGSFDGTFLTDAESFGGSVVQTVTINTEGTGDDVPLILEWNQLYGAATSDLEIVVFHNGLLYGEFSNRNAGQELNNPLVDVQLPSGTYQVAIENLSGPNPGLIKEITAGDGFPATISGANTGTVVGHAMTPGAISAGAVSAAVTPAFGFDPTSEIFSSSGAGAELFFANNGTALSSPDVLSPVAVSGIDDISTTVTGNLGDFYGTSAASASLAGVAALVLAANPSLTPAQVEQIMEETALPMANSAVSGAGLVQVDAAVAAAEALVTTVIELFGSTKLVEIGNDYFLDSISSGIGPELKYAGAPVVAGEFGAWAPIGAEQTANGYEVALKVSGADQYTIWSTDSSGNFISNIGAASGTSLALESAETSFHQDLNGDGIIGAATTVIEADGLTYLTEIANQYFLYDSSGSGPSLKYLGAPVVSGEFGTWTPIGAEQTASGYEVALKVSGADQYTIWNTDSSGNFVSNIGVVSGTSLALEWAETNFHQDLNGDRIIGAATTVIEADGLTYLTEVANQYFLYDSGGSGPSLKYLGTPVASGEFGTWTPIGAEQTANGYEVALKVSGADQYTIWNTDSSGNYISNVGAVSGTSLALESAETSFHQDLNGDGVIGVPSANPAAIAAAEVDPTPPAFTGLTLTLDASSPFSGQIIGFAGNGSLQGSDQIDLRGVDYDSIHSAYDGSTGILAVNDGFNTTDIQFLGNYSQANFKFADDGGGGSIVYAQTGSSQPPISGGNGPAVQAAGNSVYTAGQDTFVFASNFGQVSIANFAPATDTIQISKTVFANIGALLAATHDDSRGNAVITDAAHDTITIQNVTAAQLQSHQGDFQLV